MIYTKTSSADPRFHSDKKITMSFDEYEALVKKNLNLLYEVAELREELELSRLRIKELKGK